MIRKIGYFQNIYIIRLKLGDVEMDKSYQLIIKLLKVIANIVESLILAEGQQQFDRFPDYVYLQFSPQRLLTCGSRFCSPKGWHQSPLLSSQSLYSCISKFHRCLGVYVRFKKSPELLHLGNWLMIAHHYPESLCNLNFGRKRRDTWEGECD